MWQTPQGKKTAVSADGIHFSSLPRAQKTLGTTVFVLSFFHVHGTFSYRVDILLYCLQQYSSNRSSIKCPEHNSRFQILCGTRMLTTLYAGYIKVAAAVNLCHRAVRTRKTTTQHHILWVAPTFTYKPMIYIAAY